VKNQWFRVGYLTDSLIFGELPVKGPYTQLLPTSPFLKKRESHTIQVTTHSNRIPAHRHLTKCVLRGTSSSNLKMMNRCIHGTTSHHQSIANIKRWMKGQKKWV